MKKWSIRIFLMLAGLLVLGAAIFLIYAQFQYGPSTVLKEQVNLADIETKEEGLLFRPDEPNGKGVIFYQGAKVQEEAYAYLAEQLSAEGYLVIIPQLPLNFGILSVNKAGAAIDNHPEIERWFIGGHSLGGVAAAMYAEKNVDKVAGLYFLASYPAGDFSSTELPMLSIYAERDGLLMVADIEKNRNGFSPNSRFVEIAGGNHAQFGLYGTQKGDSEANIAPLNQQNQVAEALLAWLNEN